MTDFTALKTAIQNAIKQNGNEEITGNLLQEVLLAIVTTLGDGSINELITALGTEATTRSNADTTLQQNIDAEATTRSQADTALGGRIDGVIESINAINAAIGNGYVYAGIATPSSTPTTGKVFYLALTAGTYTNFGNFAVTQGINILKYNGSAWSLDAFVGIDDTPTPSSNNLVKSSGVFNDIMTNGSAFDLSAYNGGATYADLNAALTALNTLPAAYKRGGMSFKFVQSSDNKYVSYRLMADEFTTDTTQWATADEGVYVENPEFVYVKTDAEGKILWAIKIDGGIYYGAGVPQQVIDYIQAKISELSLDEYEDIVAFLNGLEEGDKTFQTLLNEKVDKEEGKSLIDEDYASSQSAIDNPEFLEVTLDAEDKVLEGIQKDGTKVIGGDFKVLGNMKVSDISYTVIENPEYLAAWVDANGKLIFGFKTDGKTYVGDADFLDDIESIKAFLVNLNDKNIDWDALTSITATENPEFIEAKTDSEGKLLAGRTPDGAAFENVGLSTPKISIDGATLSNFNDPEGRIETITDKDGKIVCYRKENGTKVENVGIETNSLKLSQEGMSEFQKALKDSGFNPGSAGDYSDYISNDGEKPLKLPIPKIAFINILTDVDLTKLTKSSTAGAIERLTYDVRTQVEYSDCYGNYFKKWALISGQGNSSMKYDKRNIAFDFFDDDVYDSRGRYGKGDAFSIKFGEWVSQDSFHAKAYYTDFFRGCGVVAYHFGEDIYNSRGKLKDRTWKRALIPADQIHTSSTESVDIAQLDLQVDTGAKCFPDGFPCIFYQNGEFWGIFSLQLKKHRDNYHMMKDVATNIHLDGTIAGDTFFQANGDASKIGWVPSGPADIGFEVRNPKDDCLVTMAGKKYDADSWESQELAGISYNGSADVYSESTTYSKSDIVSRSGRLFMSRKDNNTGNIPVACKKPSKVFDNATEYWFDITFTNEVKQHLLQHSTVIPTLQAAETGGATASEIKAIIEQYYDPENIIDYLIHISVLMDKDSLRKNWQWTTWDGIKWYVNPYDMDCVFGTYFLGNYAEPIYNNNYLAQLENVKSTPVGWIVSYYKAEIKARWNELYNSKICSVENIYDKLNNWVKSIGLDYFKLEYKKWNESPCNRDSLVDEHWLPMSPAFNDPWYANRSYGVGSRVVRNNKVYKSLSQDNIGNDPETDGGVHWENMMFDNSKTYSNDERCYMGDGTWFYMFASVGNNNLGNPPMTGVYDLYPQGIGYHDTLWRVYKWLYTSITTMNTNINNLV